MTTGQKTIRINIDNQQHATVELSSIFSETFGHIVQEGTLPTFILCFTVLKVSKETKIRSRNFTFEGYFRPLFIYYVNLIFVVGPFLY